MYISSESHKQNCQSIRIWATTALKAATNLLRGERANSVDVSFVNRVLVLHFAQVTEKFGQKKRVYEEDFAEKSRGVKKRMKMKRQSDRRARRVMISYC